MLRPLRWAHNFRQSRFNGSSTVNTWISDIRARQKESRDTIIIRLSRLGWTQDMIAEITGMTQGRVAQIINNTKFGEINNLLSIGHDMDYVARQALLQRVSVVSLLRRDQYQVLSTCAKNE